MAEAKLNSSGRSEGREEAWLAFREAADADWELEMAEEMRRRVEELPAHVVPFKSPVIFPEIEIEQDVPIAMRDGVVLRADVYRPASGEKFPVAINRGPYDKTSTLDMTPSVARNLAKRGYVCICQDIRGRYQSEGDYVPLENEIEDGVDTVEWAAAQPWSNGAVGIFGISYGGFSSYCAAIGQAPHLKCIYPAMIGYGPDLRTGGIPQLNGFCAWQIWAGQGRECGNVLRIDTSHLPLCEIDDKSGLPNPNFDTLVCTNLDTPVPGEISDQLVMERLAQIECPAYIVAGWYDELIEGTIETWCRLVASSPDARLMIGPWHHNLCDMEEPRVGKLPLPDVESKRYFEHMEMFMAQHLKGEVNAISQAIAPVKLYVMGANEWRDEYEWPLARTDYQPLYLHSSGAAGRDIEDGLLDAVPNHNEQANDEYSYDPLNPVSLSDETDVFSYLDEMGDRSDIQCRPDVLVYSTPVLERDLEITGNVKAVLYASSNCEDTDFVINLVDVHPNGHTQYLTHGIVRARYRHGIENPALIEPRKIYCYDIEMRPTSNLFLRGHRMRIEITSSDFSRYARNQNIASPQGRSADVRIARQSVFHGGDCPSHLLLPIIPNS